MRIQDISALSVSPETPIREVMERFNRSGKQIALIVNGEDRLKGIATDGDIRRALLRDFTIGTPVREAMKKDPVVAPDTLSSVSALKIMKANSIRHLPIVDEDGRIVALEILDFVNMEVGSESLTAVIMAGGEGQRLRPLTNTLPKPMLPVGDRPILEIMLRLLQASGFNRVLISVGYLGCKIQEYFENGSRIGMDIHYLEESKPQGTAGSLGLIPDELKPDSPFLVINGDLLTRLDFNAFRSFHIAADYELTLCCRPYEVEVPYGYPVIAGDAVVDFQEKPTFHHLVNSGIYCLSPALLKEIPHQSFFHMTDLIQILCKSKRRVGVFPLREPFHEIGRMESYESAEEFFQQHFVNNDTESN
jgi:dTDP-glucose pyrophosphorylase